MRKSAWLEFSIGLNDNSELMACKYLSRRIEAI